MRARLLGIAAVVAAAAAAVPSRADARATAPWKIAPEPRWLAPAPDEPPTHAPADPSAIEYLLDDNQVRVSAANVERYHHVKYRPRSPDQVEDVSQVELELNPAHERLAIHYVRVLRAGRAVFKLAPADVRIVQRERDLEQRIYDGTLTAVIFLRDVRVDDVVEYAYTLEGSDPLLGGKYVGRFSLADETFTAVWRQRIVMPPGRSLTVKAHGLPLEPKVYTLPEGREYLWEQRDVAPVEPEDRLPVWFDEVPWVDVSEFGTWAEVAGLFERLFPPRRAPGPAMAAEIAKLRALQGTDEERLLEATRFVQDEIRYLGLELGLGGHKPFEPAVVLERRFGDCKDKALLLVTLLRELGFSARAALVDTGRQRGLDDVLPSPYAFDHAIVEVTVGATSHFIDPTVSFQRGPLDARQPPELERALLVAPDTKGLVPIPRSPLKEPSVAVRETFTVANDGASADLEVETTLRHDDADAMRARLARQGKKEIGREYLNYYAEDDATVTQAGELEARDDERRNVLVVRERYHFGTFWLDSRRQLRATALEGHLKDPHIKLRKTPFALEFPFNVSHTTVVRLPTPPDVEAEVMERGDDHVRFSFSAHAEGKDVVIRYDLRTLADWVAPEKAQRFFNVLDEIRRRTGYVLHRPDGRGGNASELKTPAAIVGLVILGICVLAMLVAGGREVTRSRRGHAFKRQTRFASGEVAATAIELASEDEAPLRVAALRCACGARYQAAPWRDSQRVTYDGRSLIVLQARCPNGHERPVFLSVRTEAGPATA